MLTEGAGFHFAQPLWLLALLVPLAVWFQAVRRRRIRSGRSLDRYADRHLLPYLALVSTPTEGHGRLFAAWTLLWALGVVALAGPRWDYTEVTLFRPGADVVILLDLSKSMDATDVKPSRLGRARQEIEDLIKDTRGVRIGLVAFASVAHVVAPVTEDAVTLRHLLPALSTDLVRLTGSRLTAGLDRAERLLAGQPPDSTRSVLLISDGDFAENGLLDAANRLRSAGIKLHVLGVGTPQGGEVPGPAGVPLRDSRGWQVKSPLDEAGLQALAQAGGGIYRRADYRGDDTAAIVASIRAADTPEADERDARRIWHERFDIPLLLMMALIVLRFRQRLPATMPTHGKPPA